MMGGAAPLVYVFHVAFYALFAIRKLGTRASKAAPVPASAVGTFLWAPSPIVLAGAALIALSGDRRARAEERLLADVFGDEYRDYCRRTARTIPGLY